MSPSLVLLMGGVAPALLWGVTGIFQKQSAAAGLDPFRYMLVLGLVVAAAGGVGALAFRGGPWPAMGVGHAALAGLGYSAATALMSLALWRYGVPVSKIAPILSCNVLVTVLVGAFFLGEGATLSLGKLLVGTLLIVAGAILVSVA
jgi:uncharacterized membrane protein